MTREPQEKGTQPSANVGEGAILPGFNLESTILRLHTIFCEKTGTTPKLIFSKELWARLLQGYEWDGPALAADLQLVIRYLKKQIDADKRNPGALKLRNLLQPDQFDADVTEARIVMPQKKKVVRTEDTEATEVEEPLSPEEAERFRIERQEAYRRLKEANRYG